VYRSAIDTGRKLTREEAQDQLIIVDGLSAPEAFVQMDIWARMGDPSKVQELLRRIPSYRKEAWMRVRFHSLLKACIPTGAVAMAKEILEEMDRRNMKKTSRRFGKLLAIAREANDVKQAEIWAASALQELEKPDVVVFSSMITMWSKLGKVREAEAWFHKSEEFGVEADAQMLQDMIIAHAQSGNGEGAIRWCQKAREANISFDGSVVGPVIRSFVEVGELRTAEDWLDQALESGWDVEINAFNNIATGYLERHDVEGVLSTFKKATALDITMDAVAYNTLMQAHAENQDIDNMRRTLDAMLAAKVTPTEATASVFLPTLAAAGLLHETKRTAAVLSEHGLEDTPRTACAIATAHIVAGDVAGAENFVNERIESDLEMNSWVVSPIMELYANQGDLDAVAYWLDRAEKAGAKPDIYMYNVAMMGAACLAGSIDSPSKAKHVAEWWFNKAVELGLRPDVFSYTQMIKACARDGSVLEAESWYKRMRASRVPPNEYTYSALITTVARSNRPNLKKAWHWMNSMLSAGLRPSARTYSRVIQSMKRGKEAAKYAPMLLQNMQACGVSPDGSIAEALSWVLPPEQARSLLRNSGDIKVPH